MALAQYQGPGRGVPTHGRFVSREEIANRMYQLAGGKAAYRVRASPTTSPEQCVGVGENGSSGIPTAPTRMNPDADSCISYDGVRPRDAATVSGAESAMFCRG